MFIKELHELLIPHYNRIVDDHENTVLVRSDKTGKIDRVREDLTVEDLQRRIDMLESIAGVEGDTEIEEEEIRYYVEGNETLH